MPGTTICRDCLKQVSWEAATCPHCGAICPANTEEEEQTRRCTAADQQLQTAKTDLNFSVLYVLLQVAGLVLIGWLLLSLFRL